MTKIIWSTYALKSYWEELDFIHSKWGFVELENFEKLVNDFLQGLTIGTLIGKHSKNTTVYSFVISKQTTFFYRKRPLKNDIELLLFWNNKKDPKKLWHFLKNTK